MRTTVSIVYKENNALYSFRAVAHPGKPGKWALHGLAFPSKQSIYQSVYAHFGPEIDITETQEDPAYGVKRN